MYQRQCQKLSEEISLSLSSSILFLENYTVIFQRVCKFLRTSLTKSMWKMYQHQYQKLFEEISLSLYLSLRVSFFLEKYTIILKKNAIFFWKAKQNPSEKCTKINTKNFSRKSLSLSLSLSLFYYEFFPRNYAVIF